MSEGNNSSNRRQFLGAAFAGSATVTAGSMLIPAPLLAATGSPVHWDRETDVLIVGFGAGGSAAALEATAAGAKVLILERMQSAGGAMALSGGIVYMGGGTTLQKALGIQDTPDNMYNYLLAAVGDGANPELLRVYCDKSAELYDWLVSKGVKFKTSFISGKYVVAPTDDGLAFTGNEEQEPYRSIAKPVPRGHKAQAEGFAGHALFNNPEGRVIGVVADVGGKQLKIKANRAVVLTAGGFAANKAMMAQHCPAYVKCGVLIGTDGDDGSGIRLGQSVGADVRLMGEAIAYSPIYGAHEDLVQGILVNAKAQRYAGEDAYGDWIGGLTAREYPVSYLIVDGAVMKGLPADVAKALAPVATAGSVSELATALKMSPALLENTVKLYNQMCADGQDLQFQKAKKYLKPINMAPFYAFDFGPKDIWLVTKGGLKINPRSQVMGANGSPVPSLYAAGTIASQIIGQHYPGSGTLNGQALTFGRIAGQNAAAERPVG